MPISKENTHSSLTLEAQREIRRYLLSWLVPIATLFGLFSGAIGFSVASAIQTEATKTILRDTADSTRNIFKAEGEVTRVARALEADGVNASNLRNQIAEIERIERRYMDIEPFVDRAMSIQNVHDRLDSLTLNIDGLLSRERISVKQREEFYLCDRTSGNCLGIANDGGWKADVTNGKKRLLQIIPIEKSSNR